MSSLFSDLSIFAQLAIDDVSLSLRLLIQYLFSGTGNSLITWITVTAIGAIAFTSYILVFRLMHRSAIISVNMYMGWIISSVSMSFLSAWYLFLWNVSVHHSQVIPTRFIDGLSNVMHEWNPVETTLVSTTILIFIISVFVTIMKGRAAIKNHQS